VSRRFELDDDKVMVVHDDGRVRPSPLPEGIDPQTFRNALAAVDVLYRRDGAMPTIEETYKSWSKISRKTYSKIWATSEFRDALSLRGIDMDPSAGLSPEQGMALLLLSDPTDRRSTSVKLRQLGISMPKYQAWMRQPLFAQTLRERSEQNLGDSVATALNRLVGNVEAGDQRAIEKLLEISGRYNPAAIEQANARQVILAVVEIVLKHVHDAETKKAIMADLSDTMTIVTHETKMVE